MKYLLFLTFLLLFTIKIFAQSSISFFVTSNLQGWWDNQDLYPGRKIAGLSYLFSDIMEKKRQNPHSLLLDSGDFSYGSARSFYSNQKGKNIFLESFALLPYQILTLGNRDLENIQQVEKFSRKNQIKFLASNLKSDYTINTQTFILGQKKILVTAFTYPDLSFQRKGWHWRYWRDSAKQIQKIIQLEKPDFVLGIFHLSLFYSTKPVGVSVEQIIKDYPIWDLVVAGQSLSPLPYNTKERITRIEGIPIVRAAGRGYGWLEIQVQFSKQKKELFLTPHYPNSAKKIQLADGFKEYLDETTAWRLRKKARKTKDCLQTSLFLATGENSVLLPHLKLKPFFLKNGQNIQRKHLFYWLPYFNKKTLVDFSPYDFERAKTFGKTHFFLTKENLSKTSFLQNYQKKYPVVMNDYDSRTGAEMSRKFLLTQKNQTGDYLHQIWFNYLQKNPPPENCKMFYSK